MTKIKNRVRELIEIKRQQRGGTLTLHDIAYETKLAYNTLIKWTNNNVNRFDADTLSALCDYFDVDPGDIIVKVDE